MGVVLLLENVGFTQNFVVASVGVSGTSAVSLTGATVAWECPHHDFLLTMVSEGSGVVRYVQSAGDFFLPARFFSRLFISFSDTARYRTDAFSVVVTRSDRS